MQLVASTSSTLTYRIHNAAAGRCLNRNGSNQVVIADCGNATSQQWRVSTRQDPFGGWQLRNVANSQCLQVVGASAAVGALLQTAACGGGAHQRWRLRTAPHDCTIRSRDWVQTNLCAEVGQRMRGVMVNWRQHPVVMSWLDPDVYVLTHTVNF